MCSLTCCSNTLPVNIDHKRRAVVRILLYFSIHFINHMNLFDKIKRYLAIRFPMGKDATQRIISFWEKGGADFEYYEKAEQDEWTRVFWNEDTVFYSLFQQLDTDFLLEIACGAGRHSERVVDKVKQLYLLESSNAALLLAKERFADRENVVYILNKSGFGIPDTSVSDASLSAVFSYDAMVHFEKEAVESYIADSCKKLKPNGLALFHHSNYDKNPNGVFTDNPGWRNYMTQDLFLDLSRKHGFDVVRSEIFSFSCTDSDCVTLLKKPA